MNARPEVLTAATTWYTAGYLPVPVKPDGSKAPAVRTWRDWQNSRPDPGDIIDLFTGTDSDGLGIICGAASGNLEMFELEGRAVTEGVLNQLAAAMADSGAEQLWHTIANGYVEQTPSGGLHYHYRVDGAARGNTKLARRPATADELATNPRDRIRVLIETRGAGGFTVVAPSGGRTHPTGKPWTVFAGNPATIPTLTVDQRDQLYTIAATLDQMPTSNPVERATAHSPAANPAATEGEGERPGDWYNNRTTWQDLLERHGWQISHRYPGGRLGWTRPGKNPRDGISATTGGASDGIDRLYVFSSSTEFETEQPYTKFAAYTLLEHGGDYTAAARSLRALGYGGERPAAGPALTVAHRGTQSTTTGPSGPDTGPAPDPLEHVTPVTIEDAHATFRRWLGDDYDTDALDAVLAAAAVERFDGDPLWLLLLSGSGNAKTETVQSLTGAGAILTSTISSLGALLSATSRKERAHDATGGLLRLVEPRGLLVVKDVTSILSMNRDLRAEVLGALREVYDGAWNRFTGVDGGRTLSWSGRIGLVGAVTTAWDTAHSVIASMGDRFVVVRMDSASGRQQAGRQAIRNTGHEVEMRRDLAAAAAGVLAGMDMEPGDLDEAEVVQLLAAADVVTRARTGVEYDYRGDVIDAHAPEMPTRFAKQLGQVLRGAVSIGIDRGRALQLALRCARDSMPPLRLMILEDVAANPDSSASDVRRRVNKPRTTVDRQLQALHMLGLVTVDEVTLPYGSDTRTRWLYQVDETVADMSAIAKTVPELLVSVHLAQGKESEQQASPTHTPNDETGTHGVWQDAMTEAPPW